MGLDRLGDRQIQEQLVLSQYAQAIIFNGGHVVVYTAELTTYCGFKCRLDWAQMRQVVSLFTGAGGLDLGLEAAGFHTVFASDIDEHSCASLERNKEIASKTQKKFLTGATIVNKDVNDLTSAEIFEATGFKKGELDLLAGGPPCQAFSVFGQRKGREDPRGKLVYQYLRLLGELAPKAFVFENVYGLMTIEGGAIVEELVKKLTNPCIGVQYDVKVHRVLAADQGVPQMRDRVFIVGSRVGNTVENIPPLFCKEPSEDSHLFPWRNVGQALKGLTKIGDARAHNHVGRKHSQRIIDRYSQMKFGERDHFTRINRLDPKRPSYTIIVGSDAGGGKGHVHPYEGREVTPRESARMQCFPDWFWFSGTSRHPIRQIGNAVPSLLGAVIGQQILSKIFGDEPATYATIVRELDQEHLFTSQELEALEVPFLDDQQKLALAK